MYPDANVIEPTGNSLVIQTTAGFQDVMAALLSIHNVCRILRDTHMDIIRFLRSSLCA